MDRGSKAVGLEDPISRHDGVSVILPTMNEAASVPTILPRISSETAVVSGSLPLWKVFLFILSVKLYALLIIYVLFLKTDLRNGDKGFIFRPGGQPLPERMADIEASFWERLAPYDGQWYLDIARNGYRKLAKVETKNWRLPQGNYAFFPLLPAIIRGAEGIFGDLYLTAALLSVMALSTLGAMAVWILAKDLGANPYFTVVLLLAFPTAVFQFALYTEGIFILFSGLTLLFSIRRRPGLALFAALLAGLTRPQGVLLVLPLFAEFLLPVLRRKETLSRAAILGRAVVVLAPLSGFAVLAVVSALVTGSSFSFLSIQGNWGRNFDILYAIKSAFGYGGPPADLIGLLFGVLLLPVIWRRLPLSFALYGTAMLFLPLSTGSLMSLGRFMGVSIPHFIALALVLERAWIGFRAGVVGSMALCQVLLGSGLVAWYLVG